MSRTGKFLILKHTLYILILFALYLLQSVPGLFVIFEVKPILVISAALALAMFEGEFAGGIYGALAGLLCDTGGFSLFGYNGFIVSVCCVASGLLVLNLMRCNLLTGLLYVSVTLLIRGGIEYFFAFGMWKFDNVILLFTRRTLPAILYSAAVFPLIFWMIRGVYRRFAQYEDETI